MKKAILSVLLVFGILPFTLLSQERDTTFARQLLETAMAKRDSAQYEEMIELAKQAGMIYKNIEGATSLGYAKALNQQAIALRIQGQSKKAYQLWEKSHTIRAKQLPENAKDMGWSYIHLARLLSSQSKYDSSLVIIEKAIRIAKKRQDNYQLADVLLTKAIVVESQGFIKKAIELEKKALFLLLKYYPNKRLKIAYIKLTIGTAYSYFDAQKCDKYLFEALESYNKQLGVVNFWSGTCLFMLGANSMDNKKQLDKAEEYYLQAQRIYKKTVPPSHSLNIQTMMNLALVQYLRGKKLKAIKEYKRLSKVLNPSQEGYYSIISNLYQNISEIHLEIGNPLEALNYQKQRLSILEESEESFFEVAKSKISLAKSYMAINQIASAKQLIDKVSESLKDCNDLIPCKELQQTFYHVSALYYQQLGRQEKSIGYTYQLLSISEELKDSATVAVAYSQLAENYKQQEDYQTSNYYLKKAEIANKKYGWTTANIMSQLGINFRLLGKYDTAEEYLKRAIKLEKSENPKSDLLAALYNELGILYTETQDYKIADKHLLDGINRDIKLFGENSPRLLASYTNLASSYIQQQKWEEGAKMLDKVEKELFPKEKKEKWEELEEPLVRSYFGIRHKLYAGLYKAENNPAYLDDILKNSQEAQSFEAYYSKSLNTDFAKGKVHERLYPHYLHSLEAYQEKIKQTPLQAAAYKKRIYELSEKGNQKLLRAKVLNAGIEKFADLPQEIIEQNTALEQNILLLEKKIELGRKQDWVTEANLDSLRYLLAEERLQHADLIDNVIRKEYPDYYDLKFSNDITTLATLQSSLQKEEVLLKYVVADTTIFLLAITPQQFEVQSIQKDSLLLQYLEKIQKTYKIKQTTNDDDAKIQAIYPEIATYLYQVLLQPVEHLLSKKLIIIPDGVLYNLPFESLLVTPPDADSPLSTWHYLLRDQQISYNFSATLHQWQKEQKGTTPKEGLLCIAPTFQGKDYGAKIRKHKAPRSTLEPLQFNIREATAIAELFTSKLLIGAEATLQNFLEQVANFNIIHFSTHAKADNKNGDYSQVYFTKLDSLTERVLYAKDLYGIPLNADMVVFSACETNKGELKNGEGIISLARGATYAGARSVIASAWQVNDERTKDLMIAFYKQLDKGLSKDAALQQAKLEIIKEYNIAPRYWAAFMAYGNMQPLATPASSYWLYGMGGLGLIGLLFLGFRTNNVRQKTSE